MTDDEINARITELENLIAPLAEELKSLKRKRSARQAGRASIKVRQQSAVSRDARILKKLESNPEDLYRRPDGLVKRIAKEEGVSKRKVGLVRSRKSGN